MKTSAQRHENSVQMSLKQLRDLHTMRVENDIELARRKREQAAAQAAAKEQQRLDEIRAAEEQRLAAERERERERLAAEHEHELAKERMRAETEARVLERQLELQLKQADAEILKAQASQPKRRSGALLALVAMAGLLILGGYTWQQQQKADQQVAAITGELRQAQADNRAIDKQIDELQEALSTAEASGVKDQERIDKLIEQIATLESSRKNTRTTRRPPRPRPPSNSTPRPRPKNGPVALTCPPDKPLC